MPLTVDDLICNLLELGDVKSDAETAEILVDVGDGKFIPIKSMIFTTLTKTRKDGKPRKIQAVVLSNTPPTESTPDIPMAGWETHDPNVIH